MALIKRIEWSTFVSLPIFGGLAYFMSWLLDQQISNHVLAILGGVITWFLIISLFSYRDFLKHDGSWWKSILSGIGVILGYVSLLGGLILMIFAIMPLSNEVDPDRKFIMLTILGGSVIYCIFSQLFLWSRYVVSDGEIVIVNNKLLYPREKYKLWLLVKYEINKLHEKVNLPSQNLSLNCKDGHFDVVINTSVKLDIDKARLHNVASVVNLRELRQGASDWVARVLTEQSGNMTFGELLKYKPTTQTWIGGLPIVWAEKGSIGLVSQ